MAVYLKLSVKITHISVIFNGTVKSVEEKPYFGTSKILLSNILLNISSNSDIYGANMNTS